MNGLNTQQQLIISLSSLIVILFQQSIILLLSLFMQLNICTNEQSNMPIKFIDIMEMKNDLDFHLLIFAPSLSSDSINFSPIWQKQYVMKIRKTKKIELKNTGDQKATIIISFEKLTAINRTIKNRIYIKAVKRMHLERNMNFYNLYSTSSAEL